MIRRDLAGRARRCVSHDPDDLGVMTGVLVAGAAVHQGRPLPRAQFALVLAELVRILRTAGSEPAARHWDNRNRDLAREDDPASRALCHGVGVWNSRQQSLGVGMGWTGEELFRGAGLDDDAEVHHRDAVRNMTDDRQVMGDEQVGEPELLFQVLEEVDHPGAHRDVKGRNGFVENDHLGPQRQRACDLYALTLTARELVGIAVCWRRMRPALRIGKCLARALTSRTTSPGAATTAGRASATAANSERSTSARK